MGRVLVIEDNADSRELFVRLVEEAGHTATGAATCNDGLAECQRAAFDLVLMDLFVPGMPAAEFLEHLRKGIPQPEVVLMTSEPRIEMAANALGIRDFLKKPIDTSDLRNCRAFRNLK